MRPSGIHAAGQRVAVVTVGAHGVVRWQGRWRRWRRQPAASCPMYRWQKPPIFFRPYICAAFSSNLRMRSILSEEIFLELRAEARSLFLVAHPRSFPQKWTTVFPALHRQEVGRLFNDCLQDDQVTRVVRELPERAQPGAEHLEDLRPQRGVLHDVDRAADADDLVQRRRLEHPLHPRVLAHLHDLREPGRRDGIDGARPAPGGESA